MGVAEAVEAAGALRLLPSLVAAVANRSGHREAVAEAEIHQAEVASSQEALEDQEVPRARP